VKLLHCVNSKEIFVDAEIHRFSEKGKKIYRSQHGDKSRLSDVSQVSVFRKYMKDSSLHLVRK